MQRDNVYMVSVEHPKPLGIKQESTNNDVATSELSNPLCSIIDAISLSSKKEREKNVVLDRIYWTYRDNIKPLIHTACPIR